MIIFVKHDDILLSFNFAPFFPENGNTLSEKKTFFKCHRQMLKAPGPTFLGLPRQARLGGIKYVQKKLQNKKNGRKGIMPVVYFDQGKGASHTICMVKNNIFQHLNPLVSLLGGCTY